MKGLDGEGSGWCRVEQVVAQADGRSDLWLL